VVPSQQHLNCNGEQLNRIDQLLAMFRGDTLEILCNKIDNIENKFDKMKIIFETNFETLLRRLERVDSNSHRSAESHPELINDSEHKKSEQSESPSPSHENYNENNINVNDETGKNQEQSKTPSQTHENKVKNKTGKNQGMRTRQQRKRKSYTNTDDGKDSKGSANIMAKALLDLIKSKSDSSRKSKTFRQIASDHSVSVGRLHTFYQQYINIMKSTDADSYFTYDKNGIVEHKSLVMMLQEQPSCGKSTQLVSDFVQESICILSVHIRKYNI
jgi:hypothetical protein